MDELLKIGDRRVKTSEKQVGMIKSFFQKIRSGKLKDTIIKSVRAKMKSFYADLLYEKYRKELDMLKERAEQLLYDYNNSSEKENLKYFYDSLKFQVESCIKKVDNYEFPDVEIGKDYKQILNEEINKINETLSGMYDKSNKIGNVANLNEYENSNSQKFEKAKNSDNLSKIDNELEKQKKVDSLSIEPINIDKSIFKNNIEPQRYEPGELSAIINKKNDNKLAVDNKKKDIKEKFDLSDLTIFKSYVEYKKAYFWNKYINEYGSDVLEKISSLLAKTADTNSKDFKGLLSEIEYDKLRNKQEKDKEIFEIKANHEKAISNLNEAKKKAVDDTKKEFREKINSLSEELNASKSDIKKLKTIIKIQMEAIDKASEISKTIGGIPAIDEAITACKTKCDSINEKSAVSVNSKEGNDDLENTAIAYAEAVKNQGKHFKQEMPKGNDDLENAAVAYATAIKEQESNNPKEKKLETKGENSDKKNASESPTKDSLEVSNISMQQVPQASDDDVKESNELINELSIIDKGLDDYSGMLDYVNQSNAFSNEQKEILRNKIYSDFDQFVEQNPENKPARVR